MTSGSNWKIIVILLEQDAYSQRRDLETLLNLASRIVTFNLPFSTPKGERLLSIYIRSTGYSNILGNTN